MTSGRANPTFVGYGADFIGLREYVVRQINHLSDTGLLAKRVSLMYFAAGWASKHETASECLPPALLCGLQAFESILITRAGSFDVSVTKNGTVMIVFCRS